MDEEDIGVTEGPMAYQILASVVADSKAKEHDDTVYIDRAGLSAEMSSWVYPLHFIDFETTMVAMHFWRQPQPL